MTVNPDTPEPAPAVPQEPDIDTDEIRNLLGLIENRSHQRGWKSEPDMTVYVVCDSADLATAGLVERAMQKEHIRGDRYTARVMLAEPAFVQAFREANMQPPEALRRFVMNSAYAEPDALDEDGRGLLAFRALLRQPGIIGFAACFEAYGFKQLTEVPTLLNDPRHFEDINGSREIRVAVMVDVADGTHCIRRFRGEEPAYTRKSIIRDGTMISLRILADLAADRLPQDGDAFDQRYTLGHGIDRGSMASNG